MTFFLRCEFLTSFFIYFFIFFVQWQRHTFIHFCLRAPKQIKMLITIVYFTLWNMTFSYFNSQSYLSYSYLSLIFTMRFHSKKKMTIFQTKKAYSHHTSVKSHKTSHYMCYFLVLAIFKGTTFNPKMKMGKLHLTSRQTRCRWVCFIMKKCSTTSLAHQRILCSEWVPSEWESKQLIKTS